MAAVIKLSAPTNTVPFSVAGRSGPATAGNTLTTSTVTWTTSNGLTVSLTGPLGTNSAPGGDPTGTGTMLTVKRGAAVLRR